MREERKEEEKKKNEDEIKKTTERNNKKPPLILLCIDVGLCAVVEQNVDALGGGAHASLVKGRLLVAAHVRIDVFAMREEKRQDALETEEGEET